MDDILEGRFYGECGGLYGSTGLLST